MDWNHRTGCEEINSNTKRRSNISKYRPVRSAYGRKNISLSNRLAAVHFHEHTPFLPADEVEQYRELRKTTFKAIVSAHELIGHGCGKLLAESSPGNYNFNLENPPISPLTGQPITTWYKVGEIPKSVFGRIYNTFNECLAESIALFLLGEDEDLLSLLGAIGNGRKLEDGRLSR